MDIGIGYFISCHVILLFILGASSPVERSVLFSGSVIKVNRRGRTQERWLMITGQTLLNCVAPKNERLCKLHIAGKVQFVVAMYTINCYMTKHCNCEWVCVNQDLSQ